MELSNWKKKICHKNFVVIVKLIVDGNWIYSFENISSSMFPAHCDTLKKYEQKFFSLSTDFVCVHVWKKDIDDWRSVNLNSILRDTYFNTNSLVFLSIIVLPIPGTHKSARSFWPRCWLAYFIEKSKPNSLTIWPQRILIALHF